MRFRRARRRCPSPSLASLDKPFDLLVTGVGGTGVITVGALITMAAHLEGKGARCSTSPASRRNSARCCVHPARRTVPTISIRCASTGRGRRADRLRHRGQSPRRRRPAPIGPACGPSSTLAEMPTGDIVRIRDADLQIASTADGTSHASPATDNLSSPSTPTGMAETLFGDTVFANVIMLGRRLAARIGAGLAGSADARDRVERRCRSSSNKQAFASGRLAAADP